MTATVCGSCHRTVEIEPVKCPYCTALQPNRAFDLAMHRLRLALLGCVGLFFGLAGGYLATPQAVPPVAVRVPIPAPNAAQEQAREELRAALRSALDAAARAGVRSVAGEDLVFDAPVYADQRIVVSGFLEFAQIKASSVRFCISDRWGGGPFIGVDGAALPVETRKELLRRSWPPHVIVARGRWTKGVIEGLGGPVGYYLNADAVAFVGSEVGGDLRGLR